MKRVLIHFAILLSLLATVQGQVITWANARASASGTVYLPVVFRATAGSRAVYYKINGGGAVSTTATLTNESFAYNGVPWLASWTGLSSTSGPRPLTVTPRTETLTWGFTLATAGQYAVNLTEGAPTGTCAWDASTAASVTYAMPVRYVYVDTAKATFIVTNDGPEAKVLRVFKTSGGGSMSELASINATGLATTTATYTGFVAGDCVAAFDGATKVGEGCFSSIEGGKPGDLQIVVQLDPPPAHEFEITMTNDPLGCDHAVVYSGSTSGNESVTLTPGGGYSKTVPLVAGDQIKVTVDGKTKTEFTVPNPPVAVAPLLLELGKCDDDKPAITPDPNPTDPWQPTPNILPTPGADPSPTPDPITEAPDPTPQAPPTPGNVTATPLQADAQSQVKQLEETLKAQNAKDSALLESIEKNTRETRDENKKRQTKSQQAWNDFQNSNAYKGALDGPTGQKLLDQLPAGTKDSLDKNKNQTVKGISQPTDGGLGFGSATWMVDVTLGVGQVRKMVDLNPLNNETVASYVASMAQWCRAIIYIIVTVIGSSLLYDQYFWCFSALMAPRGALRMGVGVQVGVSDLITAAGTIFTGLTTGAATFGASTAAAGALLIATLGKFVVPTLIHIFFLGLTLAPSLIALASQGMVGTIGFSLSDHSAAPGTGVSNLLDVVGSAPGFIQPVMQIFIAFVPLAYLITYWISYIVTKRVLQISTAAGMTAQASLGKS